MSAFKPAARAQMLQHEATASLGAEDQGGDVSDLAARHSKDGDDGGPASGSVRRSSEDIEEEAYQALRKKAAETGAKHELAKKPTAAATSRKKRPAAAVHDYDLSKVKKLQGFKIEWTHGDEKLAHGIFNCKQYQRANKILKTMTPRPSAEEISATLKDVVRRASAVYMQHAG